MQAPPSPPPSWLVMEGCSDSFQEETSAASVRQKQADCVEGGRHHLEAIQSLDLVSETLRSVALTVTFSDKRIDVFTTNIIIVLISPTSAGSDLPGQCRTDLKVSLGNWHEYTSCVLAVD